MKYLKIRFTSLVKHMVANADSMAKQITNINIEGMNEEQFKTLSEQMNPIFATIDINNGSGCTE